MPSHLKKRDEFFKVQKKIDEKGNKEISAGSVL